MYTFMLVFLVLFIQSSLSFEEKRLLLNDPDALTRLGNMEHQIQLLSQQNQQLTQQNQQLVKDVKILQESQSQATQGSTYIRWGRTECPTNETELIYSGFAAGQYYTRTYQSGGPTNTLCLPRDPELSNVTIPTDWCPLYGTEYQSNSFASDSSDNDVPCSVCRNAKTASSIMIPGRRTCYTGWTKEYHGILSGGYTGHTPSSYICVDSKPEYLQHGRPNEDGHLIYPVHTKCGALPCPPYKDMERVDCVVCSK